MIEKSEPGPSSYQPTAGELLRHYYLPQMGETLSNWLPFNRASSLKRLALGAITLTPTLAGSAAIIENYSPSRVLAQEEEGQEEGNGPIIEVAGVTTEEALPADGEVESPTVVPEVVVPPSVIKPENTSEVAGVTSSTENPQILVPAPEAPPPIVARPPFDRFNNPDDLRLVLAVNNTHIMTEVDLTTMLPAFVRLHNRLAGFNTPEDLAQSVIRYGSLPTPTGLQIDSERRQYTQIGIDDSWRADVIRRIQEPGRGQLEIPGEYSIRASVWRALERLATPIVNDPVLGQALKDFWDPTINPESVQKSGLTVFVNGTPLEAFYNLDNYVIDMKECNLFSSRERGVGLGNHILLEYTNRVRELLSPASWRNDSDVLGAVIRLGSASMRQKGETVGDRNAELQRGFEVMRAFGEPNLSSLGQFYPAWQSISRDPRLSGRIC